MSSRKRNGTQGGIDRRTLLLAAGAAGVSAMLPRVAYASPRVGPPNLIEAGKLIMSINPTLPPLQFVNDRGELQGMRVELGNKVAEQLGLTPEYIRIEFSAMIPGLAARRWDMINTGIFWTEERSQLMYMVPYERVAIGFLTARDNPTLSASSAGRIWPDGAFPSNSAASKSVGRGK